MQCELSKAELITLDLAIINRASHGRITLRDHGDEGNDKDRARLEARIQHLDALHVKLDALIERAE